MKHGFALEVCLVKDAGAVVVMTHWNIVLELEVKYLDSSDPVETEFDPAVDQQ